jgi:hypothetical protein
VAHFGAPFFGPLEHSMHVASILGQIPRPAGENAGLRDDAFDNQPFREKTETPPFSGLIFKTGMKLIKLCTAVVAVTSSTLDMRPGSSFVMASAEKI